jgi:hypothetical protein
MLRAQSVSSIFTTYLGYIYVTSLLWLLWLDSSLQGLHRNVLDLCFGPLLKELWCFVLFYCSLPPLFILLLSSPSIYFDALFLIIIRLLLLLLDTEFLFIPKSSKA